MNLTRLFAELNLNPDSEGIAVGDKLHALVYIGRRLEAGQTVDEFRPLLHLDGPSHRFASSKKSSFSGPVGGVYLAVFPNENSMYTKGNKSPRFIARLTNLKDLTLRLMLTPAEEESIEAANPERLLLFWSAADRAVTVALDLEKEEARLSADAGLAAQLSTLRELYANTSKFRRPALLAAIIYTITS